MGISRPLAHMLGAAPADDGGSRRAEVGAPALAADHAKPGLRPFASHSLDVHFFSISNVNQCDIQEFMTAE